MDQSNRSGDLKKRKKTVEKWCSRKGRHCKKDTPKLEGGGIGRIRE